MFPLLKDKVKQYEWDTEVMPGIRLDRGAPAIRRATLRSLSRRGKEQLMVLSDTTNMPALFAKHPSWHGQIDADPVLAEATRRRLFDRAVSDKGDRDRLPLPVSRPLVRSLPDGAGYTFVPACVIEDDGYGNGHRPASSMAVSDAGFDRCV